MWGRELKPGTPRSVSFILLSETLSHSDTPRNSAWTADLVLFKTSIFILDCAALVWLAATTSRCFASGGPVPPWPLTLRGGSRQAERRNMGPWEGDSHALPREPCLTVALKMMGSERKWWADEWKWMWECSHKTTNVKVSVKPAQIGSLLPNDDRQRGGSRWCREMKAVSVFLFHLRDSGGESEGEKKVVALREQSAQMCQSVTSQFGFCGETPVPAITFSFHSFRRCGSVSIVPINATHALYLLAGCSDRSITC